MRQKVFISIGAGQTGKTILQALLAKKSEYEIVCGVFSEEAEKQESILGKYDVQMVRLNGLKPETLTSALTNVNTLILIPIGHEKRIAISNNFIDSSIAARVSNVVLISTFSAENKDYYFANQFREIEKKLESTTSLNWCIVRPNFYMENLLIYAPQIRSTSSIKLPTENEKFAPVAVEDVGEMVKNIVWDIKEHHQRTYGLTGPVSLTGPEMAEIASKALGKTINFESCSEDELKAILNEQNVCQDTIKGLIGYYKLVREGYLNVVRAKEFERISERPPRDMLYFFFKASRLLQV